MININDQLLKEDLALMKPNAFAVLMAITCHLNKHKTAFPGIPRLCKMTGLGKNSVYAAIQRLIELEYLCRWQTNEDGMFGKTMYKVTSKYLSVYVSVDNFEMEETDEEKDNRPLPKKPHTVKPLPKKPHTVKGYDKVLTSGEVLTSDESINELGSLSPTGEAPETIPDLNFGEPPAKAASGGKKTNKKKGYEPKTADGHLMKEMATDFDHAYYFVSGQVPVLDFSVTEGEGIKWSNKEFGNLKTLSEILKERLKKRNLREPEPIEIRQNFRLFLEMAIETGERFVLQNFTPSMLHNQFNQIVLKIQQRRNGKHINSGSKKGNTNPGGLLMSERDFNRVTSELAQQYGYAGS